MISFHWKDESEIAWESDSDVERVAFMKAFSFESPGYRFTPAYKRGIWDGMIPLVKRTGFGLGLLRKAQGFCHKSGIRLEIDPKLKSRMLGDASDESVNAVLDFMSNYRFFSKGDEITPRRDQMAAVLRSCLNDRCVNVCPTSFGKSLCIFMHALWQKSGPRKLKKQLVVVPTRELVFQLSSDMTDYASEGIIRHPWALHVQELCSGKDRKVWPKTDVMITTWQSLVSILKSDPGFLSNFQSMTLDEAHKAAATSITACFEAARDIRYKYGWTGSLKGASIQEIQAEAVIGPVLQVSTTRGLMDQKVVADLVIQPVRIHWKTQFPADYHEEVKMIESAGWRNRLVIDKAGEQENTGLILFTHLAHGETLYDEAMKRKMDVMLVDGTRCIWNDRQFKSWQELKGMAENSERLIMIASFGIFSTGISVKNIHWIMFTSPVKSFIRTVQSIGRGLRVSDTKHSVRMFDFADFPSSGRSYAMRHSKERMKIYLDSGFNIADTLSTEGGCDG